MVDSPGGVSSGPARVALSALEQLLPVFYLPDTDSTQASLHADLLVLR